jgi:hypothetical protein
MAIRRYRFAYGEPGLNLEVYLPSKFEPILRSVLDRGFDVAHVRTYLAAATRIQEIRDLLSEHDSLRRYSPSRARRLEEVFKGYSLYRGNGAFKNGPLLEHDEVTVGRIMFLPPFARGPVAARRERFAARRFLRHWTHNLDIYLADRHAVALSDLTPAEEQLLPRLQQWLDDIALFMNGYVLHRVCSEILHWRTRGLIRKAEDEIWIGSFRCLAVNKLKFRAVRRRLPQRRRGSRSHGKRARP